MSLVAHVFDPMLDHALDHMIISFMITVLHKKSNNSSKCLELPKAKTNISLGKLCIGNWYL